MASSSDVDARVIRVSTDHGAVVCAEVHGDLTVPRTKILILDGIGCTGWAFQRVLPALVPTHPVVLMHYRGHGLSPPPPRPWTFGIPDLADDAVAVLDQAEIDSCVVLGFSMGFQVGLELARRHPTRVCGLISVAGPSGRALALFQGTGAFAHLVPLFRAAAHMARGKSTELWRKVLPSRLSRLIGLRTQVNAQRIQEADFDYYMQQMAAMDPELFLTLLEEAHRHCADDFLPDLNVPTLVIAGGRDRFIPLPSMRAVAFAIPHAEWVVMPEASHALPAEFPQELAARVLEFVGRIGEPTATR